MKKLLATIVLGTGLVFGSCVSGSLIMGTNFPLPYEVQNYKNKAVGVFKGERDLFGKKVHAHSYDLDGDHIPDVSEVFFDYNKINEKETLHTEFPNLYIWNRGDDNNPENDVYYFDPKRDGLNGNEKEGTFKFVERILSN